MATGRSSLDAARFLAAALVLGAGRGNGSAARSIGAALRSSPAGRVVSRDEPGGGPASGELARALRAAALGRVSADERDWIARIEARRDELAAEHAPTDAVFAEGPERGGRRWAAIRRPGTVADACLVISVPPLWGRLLMRLIGERRPSSCVELGTGFGVSAAYQAAALELNGAGELLSFEGGESWARIAREGAEALSLERLEVRVGPLSETLEPGLAERPPVDFAFVDAEHTKDSTLAYFAALQPRLADRATLVFDDIDFDSEMWEAWTEIRAHDRVLTAVSLGRMGIVVVGAG
jgi:predicted O-methyltransferase YrrM